MTYRKLQIAWSVAWSMVAVLLVALWFRSYAKSDVFGRSSVEVSSTAGVLQFSVLSSPNYLGWLWTSTPVINIQAALPAFRWHSDSSLSYLNLPHWLLVLVASAIGAAPWLHWSRRFRLRTLLILMTIAALLVGMAAYVFRQPQQPPRLDFPTPQNGGYYQPVQ